MKILKWIFFVSAVLVVGVPIFRVFASEDIIFSSSVSNLLISLSLGFFILGMLINVYEKKKANARFARDVGMIIGLFLVLLFRFVG